MVAAGFGEGLEIGIAGRNHQMCVEDLLGVRAHRLDDIGAVGNVGDEMPVHHVKMDPVGTGRIDGADLLAELGEIGSQDRRRDDEGAWRKGLRHLISPALQGRVERFSRNMRKAREQCWRERLPRAENSAGTASFAGPSRASLQRKTHDLLGFPQWHGVC